MRIILPYNEILPTRKAHDHFLFREATELALQGHEVDLVIGKGSLADTELFAHYGVQGPCKIHRLSILRKNTWLPVSWNAVFLRALRHWMQDHTVDVALVSVRKVARAMLKERLSSVRYLYEAHELAWYPGMDRTQEWVLEKALFESLDGLTVTTEAMRHILLEPPYSLSIPIAVIPLAVDGAPLPPPPEDSPLSLLYVGQLYPEQGICDLIPIMKEFPNLHLHILGGSTQEIQQLNPHTHNVHFHGWKPPGELRSLAYQCHACIAPFRLVGRMPYVAHTKLYLYRAWGRPILAPFHPIVQEHTPEAHLYHHQDELRSLLQQVGSLPQPTPCPSSWEQRIYQLSSTILATERPPSLPS